MLANYNRATENIMQVFQDPRFNTHEANMELEEIDFWNNIFG